MNLDVVAMPDSPALASGTNIMRYLEQAALAGRRQEFTTLLQQSLGISRALAGESSLTPPANPSPSPAVHWKCHRAYSSAS